MRLWYDECQHVSRAIAARDDDYQRRLYALYAHHKREKMGLKTTYKKVLSEQRNRVMTSTGPQGPETKRQTMDGSCNSGKGNVRTTNDMARLVYDHKSVLKELEALKTVHKMTTDNLTVTTVRHNEKLKMLQSLEQSHKEKSEQ